MKKVLAIVLSIALVFSFASLATAYEFPKDDEGNVMQGIWIGPKERQVRANPGDNFSFTIELQSNISIENIEGLEEEMLEDATLFVPFWIIANDGATTPIKGVELTDEAKEAGARLSDDYKLFMGYTIDSMVSKEETAQNYLGTVLLPASYLFSGESFDVLKVNAALAGDIEWPVDEYGEAENPQDIMFSIGGWFGYPVKLITADGSEFYLDTIADSEGGQIPVQVAAKYYEPTTGEKITEFFRTFAVKLLTGINKLIDWFMNTLLAPAKWAQ